MNKTQEKKLQVRKNLSDNQYENMGDFKFTTRDRNLQNLEKPAFSGEESSQPSFGNPLQTNPAASTPKKVNQGARTDENKGKTRLKVRENPVNNVTSREESEADQIVNAVILAKKSIVEEVSANIEKKFEKLDDAIFELISCKTENERLKAKIDNLIKETYRLKKENRSFRQVMPGFYIKTKTEEINL